MAGVAPSQVQGLALDLVEPHDVPIGPILELVQLPLDEVPPNTLLFALFQVCEEQSKSTSISSLSLPHLTGLSHSQQASRASSLSLEIGFSQ